MNKTKAKAESILKSLFDGISGDQIARDDIFKKFTPKTFYNYGPVIYEYGLAEAVKQDKKDVRKVTGVRLTDKGKLVLRGGSELPVKPATAHNVADTSAPADPGLLDAITMLTDKFNAQSKTWQWKLFRKGGAA